MKTTSIVFFDGVCNLCNASVDSILRHEAAPVFQFASLQGETARCLLPPLGKDPDVLNSLLVYHYGRLYQESEAIFVIAENLKAPWRWVRIFRFMPQSWTDAFYRWVADNRYRWLGKRQACRLPSPQERSRFLP